MAPPGRTSTRRDTVVLAACLTLGIVTRALPDTLKEPVATTLRRTALAPLVTLQRDAERSRRAWLDRNETLRAADSIALRAIALAPVQRENEELRRMLGLGARLRWGFTPAEVLRGRGIAEEFTMMLAAGSRAGIQPFSPVVSPDGLLGMIKTVDPTMSIAILWSHPDFRVSAMTEDESAYGIVAAHLEEEEGRNLLELRGVPMRSTLAPGTVVWSSGVGGVFPRGIPIGTIIGEQKNPAEVWARTYIVKPAVNPAQVDAVMVLQPDRGEDSLRNVWETPQDVQRAVRRIVVTGDSIARRRAADSAAATAPPPPGPARQPARPDSALVPRARRAPAADTARPATPPPGRTDTVRPPDSARTDTARPPAPPRPDTARPPAATGTDSAAARADTVQR
ncbi:MAG TPA: rod shape-determining protein MreC, partial [Gemmatimonadaceae bacterium]|nr:rod shape-determining protein MreC [Gemmatimonadaceae bacterium]